MANKNAANGFTPAQHLTGASYNGVVREYFIPASDGTAVFIGDLVKLAGSADAVTGVATVTQAAASDIPVGSVVGFRADPTNLTNKHRLASTARYVLVRDADDTIFEVQEDAVGGALAVTDIGLNADFVVGSGNATTGVSGMQLDTSTKATTASLPLKIIGFVRRADNEIGVANAKVLVKINSHRYGNIVAGV